MKKISTSVSPFIVLIFPVLLFVVISFALAKENTKRVNQKTYYNLGAKTIINEYPKSLINIILK